LDNKAPDAFRTISEVADELDLPQHVLRFWESRFREIKPMKRGGGRRYYRPDDVDLLRGIRHLLYGEGYTIRGVQRILREQSIAFVQAVWQEGAPQPPHGSIDEDELVEEAAAEPAAEPRGIGGRLSSLIGRDLGERGVAEERQEPPLRSAPMPRIDAADRAIHETGLAVEDEANEPDAPAVGAPRPAPQAAAPAARQGLTADSKQKLQSVLQELIACRELIDGAIARDRQPADPKPAN
jgi:DNA-binding transcriptional MerR regulator